MLIEGVQIPIGIQPVNPVPVDSWSGPYSGLTEALLSIPIEIRFPTMEVRILSPNGNLKYWFKDGIQDSDLIIFAYDLSVVVSGETAARIEADNKKFDITGGTINGSVIVNGGIIYGNGMGLSGLTIGQPEDVTYNDGIFQDFNPETRVGVVVDRFNEMFKLLAPIQPSSWDTASLLLDSTLYDSRRLITGEYSNITVDTTPSFTVAIPVNGLLDSESGNLTFSIDGNDQEVYDFTSNPVKTTGVIRYTYGDPYIGQPGKSGFWVGFKSASAQSELLIGSSNLRTAKYEHSTKGQLLNTFYLDTPLTPAIVNITASVPVMNTYISGVKTLSTGQNITNISFNIDNISSYFYSSSPTWKIIQDFVYGQDGDSDTIPTNYGETGVVTNKSTSILANKFNDTKLTFTIQAANSINIYYGNGVFEDDTKRVDTVSVETERLTSGVGLYPSIYGLNFNSTYSLLSENLSELHLLNGYYKWLSGDYSVFGSPNYNNITTGDIISGVTYRWATFNVGTVTTPSVNNITLRLNDGYIGGLQIYDADYWSNIKIYIKIGGSGWLDGTLDRAISSPYSDGDGCLDKGNSPSNLVRRITFGSTARNGVIYVRLGLKSTDTTFRFKKPTI